MTVRVALQSIEKASLLLDNEQRYGSVGRGALIYIAFIGAVSEDALKNAVDVILTANVFHNLSSSDALPRSSDSLSSFPSADVLIVPQASLGGKLKGRNVQFHALVGKSEGELLYNQFCQLMRKARGVDSTTVDSNGVPLVGSAMFRSWQQGHRLGFTDGVMCADSDMNCSSTLACHAVVSAPSTASLITSCWTPQQHCYRQLMKSLRAAYFHDRSKLFWSRHRVLVEFYKYSEEANEEAVKQLVAIGLEVAAFIDHHMRTDVERIVKHNETMMALPVAQAKKFRSDYLLAEKQHDSWCKQKIKNIMKRRPPPPYPFF